MILYTTTVSGEFRRNRMFLNPRRYSFLAINPVRSICTPGLIVSLELVVESTAADPEDACR